MIRIALANFFSGKPLFSRLGFNGQYTFISESLIKLDAKWQSAVNTAAETIDVVTPAPNESVLLTDLIITSSKKVANSTIVVQFYDGTNTEILTEMEGETAPIEFSHSFSGGLMAWKDAALQVITDQAAMNVRTLLGYLKVSEALTKTYDSWNEER